MSYLPALALSACTCLAAPAADIGLGLSAKNDSTAIVIPWNVRPSLRIEGSLQASHTHLTSESATLGSDGQPYSGTFYTTSKEMAFSLAVFGLKPLTKDLQLYCGPRVGYSHGKESMRSPATEVTHAWVERRTGGSELAAILGAEWFATRSLSISGEVGLAYARRRDHLGTVNDSLFPPEDRQFESTGTRSALVVRYYF